MSRIETSSGYSQLVQLDVSRSLNIPQGTNLLTDENTLIPKLGNISYDLTTNQLLYGNGEEWKIPVDDIAGIFINPITVPTGDTTTPSINFSGHPGTGITGENGVSVIIDGEQKFNVSDLGDVTINKFTSVGVVHNGTDGILSSSLVIDADISVDASIIDSKLSTIVTSGKVSNSATTATSINNSNTIVLRDDTGRFSTSQMTINSEPIETTDAATKSYVDSLIPTIPPAPPVEYSTVTGLSTDNIPLFGWFEIDGLLSSNGTIMCVAQNDPRENGIWKGSREDTGPWVRSTEVGWRLGDKPGSRFINVQSGSNNIRSSWLVTTPNAVIGVDPIIISAISLAPPNASSSRSGIMSVQDQDFSGFKSFGQGISASVGNGNTIFGTYIHPITLTGSHNCGFGPGVFGLQPWIGPQYSGTVFHGSNNCGFGVAALKGCRSSDNIAIGDRAIFNLAGGGDGGNISIGSSTMKNCFYGSKNIIIGHEAGSGLYEDASNNIILGCPGLNRNNVISIGTQDIQNTTYIAGINGANVVGSQVSIDVNGQLGITVSSKRLKEDIKILDEDVVHEMINKFEPSSFVIKTDHEKRKTYGLIADDVKGFAPELVVNLKNHPEDYKGEDKDDSTVLYQLLPTFLISEAKRTNRIIEELISRINTLENEMSILKGGGKM